MKAVVTPAGIHVDVPNDKPVDKSRVPFPAPESPCTRKLKRLEKLLTTCVQNKTLHAQLMQAAEDSLAPLRRTHSHSDLSVLATKTEMLHRRGSSSLLRSELWITHRDVEESKRMLLPHSAVVPKEFLPFAQRPFMWSRNATGPWWGVFDSMMLSAMTSYLSIVASVGAILWSTMVEFATAVGAARRGNPPSTLSTWQTVAAIISVLPAYLLFSFPMFCSYELDETSYRILLFYRLWEHRIVVNFKERKLSHRATRLKIAALLGFGAFNLLWGAFALRASQQYFIVMLQSCTTMSWIVYSNVNPDRQLFYITAAVRQQKLMLESERSRLPEMDEANDRGNEASIIPRFGACCHDLLFVEEKDIKYDIIALRAFTRELNKRLPRKQTEADLKAHSEAKKWVAALLTWIGRMGNTKASLGKNLNRKDHDSHGRAFFGIYHDELWHACGSFANEPNAVEATGTRHLIWRNSMSILPSVALYVGMYRINAMLEAV